MSTVAQQIQALGSCEVVVYLKAHTHNPRQALGSFFSTPRMRFAAPEVAALQAGGFKSASLNARSLGAIRRPMIHLPNLGMMVGTVNAEGFKQLRAADVVARVTPIPEISLIRPTSNEGAAAGGGAPPDNWGPTAIRANELWQKGLTGRGIAVAHLDTGIEETHPVLREAVSDWLETDYPGQIIDPSTPYDDGGHGTHTAGILGARHVEGSPMIGCAPDVMLFCAKCIERGELSRRVLTSLDWAAGKKVRVISMSMGSRTYVAEWRPVMQRLRSLGILVIAAVGNEAPNTSRSPANYPEVLSVGMTNRAGRVDPDSSSEAVNATAHQPVPKLVAPGVEITSSYLEGTYSSLTGSSMATALVAGLAALLLQAVPTLTPDQLESAIVGSCSLPEGVDKVRAGAGIPDAVRALELAEGFAPAAAAAANKPTPRVTVAKKARAKPERKPLDGRRRARRRGKRAKMAT